MNNSNKPFFVNFSLDEFYNNSKQIVTHCYELLALQSYDYDKNKTNEIVAILHSNCIKASYKNSILKDDKMVESKAFQIALLSFFAKIFLEIATKHKLYNGNKRMATAFLGYVVFKYSKCEQLPFNVSDEPAILGFIADYTNTHNEVIVVQNIVQWLIEKLKNNKEQLDSKQLK